MKTYSGTTYSLELFKLILSPEELELFDWGHMDSHATAFFDSQWKEKIADLVFTVPFKGTGKSADIIFLLEHKSYQNKKVMGQMLNYQTQIYSRKPNPVVPVLIYHGPIPEWAISLEFQDNLVGMTEDIRRAFGKNILNFKLRLLNLHELDGLPEAQNLVTHPILATLAKIWNMKKEDLDNIVRLCKNIGDTQDREKVSQMVFNYLSQYNKQKYSWQLFMDIEARLYPKGERLVEKLKDPYDFGVEVGIEQGLEKGREEGIEKGIEQGVQEGREEGKIIGLEEGRRKFALQMLADGENIAKICKYTGLTKEEVQALQE